MAPPPTIAIIIPSLNPEEKLTAFVEELQTLCGNPIVIVNDGSRPDTRFIFDRLAKMENCTVLHHITNCGKGRALKSAFAHCLTAYENLAGAVTADGDGQHAAADIVRCIHALESDNDTLFIGCRDFTATGIPWKSRWGNLFTRFIFSSIHGLKLTDTQSGLRALPKDFMRHLLDCPGERFEFETAMLLEAGNGLHGHPIPLQEIPIQTIYENGNRHTHFRPVADSLKIYGIILQKTLYKLCFFACSGGISALIDILLFSLFFHVISPKCHLPELLFSTVAARCISALCNYTINRNMVFRLRETPGPFDGKTGLQYLLLCLLIMFASYGFVKLGCAIFGRNAAVIVKIVTDILLFFVSFSIQNIFIFRKRRRLQCTK